MDYKYLHSKHWNILLIGVERISKDKLKVEFGYFDDRLPNLVVLHPKTNEKLFLVEPPQSAKNSYTPSVLYEEPFTIKILKDLNA